MAPRKKVTDGLSPRLRRLVAELEKPKLERGLTGTLYVAHANGGREEHPLRRGLLPHAVTIRSDDKCTLSGTVGVWTLPAEDEP